MSDEDFEVDFEENVMKFEGFAKIPGGKFSENVKIEGFGKITDDLECGDLHSEGLLTSKGNLRINGTLHCEGMCRCAGSVDVKDDIHLEGATKIKGSVKINGGFHAEGFYKGKSDTIVQRSAKFEGFTNLKGNLTCINVIELLGRVKIKGNILGGEIHITRDMLKESKWFRKSKVNGNILSKNMAIVDNIIVYNDIQARIVHINNNSIIYGNIYYVDTFTREDDAQILGEIIKIPESEFNV